MNNTMLVGRLTTTPQLEHTETNQKYTKITLAVTRPYKNVEGIYETDFIPVMVYNEMAQSLTEYTRAGDLIGIKGRLETHSIDNTSKLIVIADRITFLSSNTNTTDQYTQDDTNNMITPNEINPLNEGEI